MSTARTVAGDLDVARLGRIDYHEHLFQVSPLLPGDELDDERASTAEASMLRESGFDAMVDATPMGLGRQPLALARAAAASALHVVASTGAHREEHYAKESWVLDLSAEALAERFRIDATEGMPALDSLTGDVDRSRVRAGVLKMGIGYWRISAFERRVAEAVAEVHADTGLPVMVHTELATAAHEVLDLLGELGVAPARVALAHVDRNPDPGLHTELAARGAFLGYDGPARARSAPDSVILRCLSDCVAAGHAGSLLLGGDVGRSTRYRAYGGMPGMEYLGRRFVPRLLDVVGSEVVDAVLRHNPQRWLSLGC